MNNEKSGGAGSVVLAFVAFGIALAVFYGLDHFIMNIQGLPLNWDLTPAG
ncbi:MAG: hypothetical protein L3J28_01255 [Candidatus Polarisedimenticolaceae bacterium]|nr:hypothetical protein [Candidatus Polarisedimenticolaceae bacterium]